MKEMNQVRPTWHLQNFLFSYRRYDSLRKRPMLFHQSHEGNEKKKIAKDLRRKWLPSWSLANGWSSLSEEVWSLIETLSLFGASNLWQGTGNIFQGEREVLSLFSTSRKIRRISFSFRWQTFATIYLLCTSIIECFIHLSIQWFDELSRLIGQSYQKDSVMRENLIHVQFTDCLKSKRMKLQELFSSVFAPACWPATAPLFSREFHHTKAYNQWSKCVTREFRHVQAKLDNDKWEKRINTRQNKVTQMHPWHYHCNDNSPTFLTVCFQGTGENLPLI